MRWFIVRKFALLAHSVQTSMISTMIMTTQSFPMNALLAYLVGEQYDATCKRRVSTRKIDAFSWELVKDQCAANVISYRCQLLLRQSSPGSPSYLSALGLPYNHILLKGEAGPTRGAQPCCLARCMESTSQSKQLKGYWLFALD